VSKKFFEISFSKLGKLLKIACFAQLKLELSKQCESRPDAFVQNPQEASVKQKSSGLAKQSKPVSIQEKKT
jgi:hypothetical protein